MYIKLSGQEHTKPEKFENAALFPRIGLPASILIWAENGIFRKSCSNRRSLKMPALCFSVDVKHYLQKTEVFQSDGVLMFICFTLILKGALKLFCRQ